MRPHALWIPATRAGEISLRHLNACCDILRLVLKMEESDERVFKFSHVVTSLCFNEIDVSLVTLLLELRKSDTLSINLSVSEMMSSYLERERSKTSKQFRKI